jgi:hypothetical protein
MERHDLSVVPRHLSVREVLDLVEALAEAEHDQWMSWARTLMETEPISEARRQRWERYLVPYGELPEEVKEHDRLWARSTLRLLADKGIIRWGEEAIPHG